MLPVLPETIPALIIVDMQNFFFQKPGRSDGLEQVVENINHLTASFDIHGCPVVHVLSAYRPDGADWDLKMRAAGTPELIAGSLEAQIIDAIQVRPGHLQVVKTRYSAFFKTDLAEQLQGLRVGQVFVTGAYTHYCVNATVFDAYAHDFVPGLVSDAVLSHLPAEAEVMVARMRRNGYHVLSTAEVLAGLA